MPWRRTTLDNGVTIVTERMREVRSASVGFWFDVGSRDEPDGLAGTSHFLEHLLFKGTPTRSAKDIADAFDAVGGDINAFTGKEYTCYYCRVLDTDTPMALDVLADMLSNSTVDAREFESERKVILEEIAMHDDAPDELVHDLFYRSMWNGHPLGRPVLGFNDTVWAVARDTVVSYWRGRYSPSNLVVAAAGSIELESVVADGITGAELERAKGHVKGSLVPWSEAPASRMNRLGRQQLTTGEILTTDELISAFDRIEMDDVARVASSVLGDARFQVTIVGPFEEGAFDRYAA